MYIINKTTSSIYFRLFGTLYGFIEWKLNEWMKNSKVYCLINVCSCFLIILKTFLLHLNNGLVRDWLGTGRRLLYWSSSKLYHQEHATEPIRLPKNVVAAWGALIIRFHGVAKSAILVICDLVSYLESVTYMGVHIYILKFCQ